MPHAARTVAAGVGLTLAAAVALAGCGTGAAAPAVESSGGVRAAAASSATSSDAPASSGASPPTGQPAPPARVVVPAIGLDEPLIDLGIASDGAMEAPTDPADTGWFTGGGRPGGRGPTVIAGHVDGRSGPAVFAELTEVDVGDEVVVHGADGGAVTYRVEQVADYDKGEFPTPEVFGATREDTVRLITCSGDFDSVAGSYTQNRVVYGSAVSG